MKIDKSWYIKPKDKNFPTSESAGGVVIRLENNFLLVALIRDIKFKDYMLPKGKIEDGESLESAATREIAEETGLSNLKLISSLGSRERLVFQKTDWKVTHYFLYKTSQISGIQSLQEGEHDYIVEWFNIDDLPEFFWPEQRELIVKNRKKIKNLLGGK